MKILLASHNQYKIEEFQKIIPPSFELLGLSTFNLNEEIPETGTTFYENSKIKAEYGFSKTGISCFSDDSGLVIEALNGEPGVFSARYSETGKPKDNIQKVLQKMENISNRKAYFICVICFVNQNQFSFFEGKIHGEILETIQGEKGFGYDPIFKPLGYDLSFSQMNGELKNKISHRALAFEKFNNFLQNKNY